MNLETRIGKVIEVFIESIDSNKIGFKILIDNEVLEIIQIQDEYNSKIFKNDLVKVTKQVLNNEEYMSVELYEGEEYE